MAEVADAMKEGADWRSAGEKQAYRFPEDLDGPEKKFDPRCQKCAKVTYKAELVTYERIPYHKNCFRCVQCKKKLTPGGANPFGEDSFLCNVHFSQVSKGASGQADGDVVSSRSATPKPEGPSLVHSSGEPTKTTDLTVGNEWRKAGNKQSYRYPEDIGTKADPRCHLCGKTAYKAEIVTYEKIPYHKDCFKCLQCKRKLTPGVSNPWGEDTFLCNTHFSQAIKGMRSADGESASATTPSVMHKGPSLVTGRKAEDVDLSEGTAWRKAGIKQAYRYPEDVETKTDPRCNQCGKTCYKAEKVTYEKIPYHKNCFKCVQCKKRLNAGEANPFGEASYLCNVHFQQVVLGTRSGGSGDVASATSPDVVAKGKSLVTGTSAAAVDMSAGLEWRKSGEKQAYRYPEDIGTKPDPRCQVCGMTVYNAEKCTYEKIPYHKNCFKCFQCKKRLTPGEANPFGQAEFLCNVHFQQVAFGGGGSAPQGDVVSATSPDVVATGPSVVVARKSGFQADPAKIQEGIDWKKAEKKQVYKFTEDMAAVDPRCNLCSKKVYAAEKMTYEKIPYHKNCFKCIQCGKRLTTAEANPFGDESYLCNTHYLQFAHGGGGASLGAVASADSPAVEAVGPSVIGGEPPKKKKTKYKPPANRRRGRR